MGDKWSEAFIKALKDGGYRAGEADSESGLT